MLNEPEIPAEPPGVGSVPEFRVTVPEPPQVFSDGVVLAIVIGPGVLVRV
ncbi:MAG: hypothetical protein IM512_04265 [Microcystis sp. M34BS1]|nr:hypothetical protein [Microcystis sp. M34BS1]MCA2585119.1 hypothetical protein [Microcystis sp. M34BS1]